MKKMVLIISVLMLRYASVFSQSCLPSGITFLTQAQIDSFQSNYPGCTVIQGDVLIGAGNAINNLNGLSVLSALGGDLNIDGDSALISLTGLHNVKSIAGYIEIDQNKLLTDLNGLDNLTRVGNDLAIHFNSALTSLKGLEKLASVGAGIISRRHPVVDYKPIIEKFSRPVSIEINRGQACAGF